MSLRFGRYISLGFLSCFTVLLTGLLWFAAPPSRAHWADMAAAEIVVSDAAVSGTTVQMTLTFPTGLAAFADTDQTGQISADEVSAHAIALQDFLSEKIRVTSSANQDTNQSAAQNATLTVESLQQATLPPTVQAAPDTHSTLMLTYAWTQPVRGLQIHYDLFLPGVPTASCLTTILQSGQLQTFVFTPTQRSLSLTPGIAGYTAGGVLLAIAGAFVWGAMHSMSPGHGKTVVGAYLVGARATPQHAIFLAMTTTVTHTIGVFALGLVTLFAAQYILPEQLYPWLGFLSGLMVAAIGLNLLVQRFRNHQFFKKFRLPSQHPATVAHKHHECDHSHDHILTHASIPHHFDHADAPDHSYGHTHIHPHTHTHPNAHSHHTHSHLPPGADGAPVTWRSLLTLGISGGLVPCPAALVLLLSSIALGNVAFGLALVLAFSSGLAIVLTGLGLTLVYAKRLFKQVPTQLRLVKILPTVSALGIVLIGFGISTRALMQVISFEF